METKFSHTYVRTDGHNEAIVAFPILWTRVKTGFRSKFYVPLLFRSIRGTSPVHFIAIYKITTIVLGEIITVLHTPDPCHSLSITCQYFSQHPLPKNLSSCVLIVAVSDTTFHAHTEHRTTLKLIQSSRDLQFSSYGNRTASLRDLTCSKLSTPTLLTELQFKTLTPLLH